MCKEATTFDPVDLEEILFSIGDYRLCFDRKAFCLVTGLRFEDYFHPRSDFAAFRERVFPFVPLSRSVSMADLTNMFNNLLHQLSDDDVLRVPIGQIDMGFHLQTNAYYIWILETFPISSIVGSLISGVIPQAVAYPRMRRLHTPDCQRILDVTNVCSLVHLIIYKLI
uniref:Uncharacterized protein n=1 Tax=Lactuca sativa TaxID=4236 RepID=A0A9R1VNW9_LACSA|nr:hypothetical protein LSAT_V11C500236840 [Lactuca sativa]